MVEFLATLSSSGPQLTIGIKGDWVGLYRRFFKSPNFSGWFHTRYAELSQKIKAIHLEALSQAVSDLLSSTQNFEIASNKQKMTKSFNFSLDIW